MTDLIIFPSSFFNPREVDEDLQQEYDAVLKIGLYDVIIFGYDQWFNDGRLVLSRSVDSSRRAIYRGWMMKPEQYASFFQQLQARNITLITSPAEYQLLHVFPNVYEKFGSDTARMKVYPLHSKLDVEDIKKSFDRFMIKDFVKSVKGTEFPSTFDSSIQQDELDSWMEVFYKYRGDLLTGGICIKEYLELKKYGETTNEYRVFYANHRPLTITQNSGQPLDVAAVPQELVQRYQNLESPYYTVDYAELVDGTWRVLEAGDGGVSGLPEQLDFVDYYRKLYSLI